MIPYGFTQFSGSARTRISTRRPPPAGELQSLIARGCRCLRGRRDRCRQSFRLLRARAHEQWTRSSGSRAAFPGDYGKPVNRRTPTPWPTRREMFRNRPGRLGMAAVDHSISRPGLVRGGKVWLSIVLGRLALRKQREGTSDRGNEYCDRFRFSATESLSPGREPEAFQLFPSKSAKLRSPQGSRTA